MNGSATATYSVMSSSGLLKTAWRPVWLAVKALPLMRV